MKKSHIYVSILAILFFSFMLSQSYLANFIWQNYRNADIALVLDRADVKLAMEIGNYYFNGPACAKASAGAAVCYDLKKAEKGFKRAVAIDDKILWGHYQLARIYFVEGEKEKALEEINKELEENPENLRSLYVRGLINPGLGDLSGAENDFRRFTQWAPKEWAGYNDLAWILAKEGKYAEAEKISAQGIKEALGGDKNPWLWNSLGVSELNLGKYANARKSFTKAKKLADMLLLSEWLKAYPGNNPIEAERGLADFKRAIEENLKRSSVDNNVS